MSSENIEMIEWIQFHKFPLIFRQNLIVLEYVVGEKMLKGLQLRVSVHF